MCADFSAISKLALIYLHVKKKKVQTSNSHFNQSFFYKETSEEIFFLFWFDYEDFDWWFQNLLSVIVATAESDILKDLRTCVLKDVVDFFFLD